MGHAQLFDISEPLEIRVLNEVEHQVGRNTDKPIDRVVYDLLFIQSDVMRAKM